MDCLLWDLGNVTNFLLQLSWQLLSHYVLSPCFLDMFGDMGGDFCFLPWAWDYSLLRLHACVHFANHLGRKGAPQRPLRDPLPCCVLANESQWFREAGKSPHFLPWGCWGEFGCSKVHGVAAHSSILFCLSPSGIPGEPWLSPSIDLLAPGRSGVYTHSSHICWNFWDQYHRIWSFESVKSPPVRFAKEIQQAQPAPHGPTSPSFSCLSLPLFPGLFGRTCLLPLPRLRHCPILLPGSLGPGGRLLP